MALSGLVYPSAAYAEWKDKIEAATKLMYGEIFQSVRSGKDVLASEYLKVIRDLEIFKKNMLRNSQSLMGSYCKLVLLCCQIWRDWNQIMATMFSKSYGSHKYSYW